MQQTGKYILHSNKEFVGESILRPHKSTNINRHKVTVAQSVHVLQHVAFIKHSILQRQLAEKATVVFVSNSQVIPVNQRRDSALIWLLWI